MIKSMTGFGRAENTDNIYSFNVEIKTVNNRYNDIVVKMPKYFSYLEEDIKRTIKDKISRGRVEVYIGLEYIDQLGIDVKVDIPLAKSYKEGLEELINELDIVEDVKLSHIISVSDVIKTERKELDEDLVWNCLKVALDNALDNVVSMRKSEGLVLKKDMEKQLIEIQKLTDKIRTRSPLVVIEYKAKLEERIKELLGAESNLDEERLESEIVFFANKSDINEEIIRLESHIHQFSQSLTENKSVGRKLDFLTQEMNREINTIGSKANDLDISNSVVDLKSELEKIREQAQNVE